MFRWRKIARLTYFNYYHYYYYYLLQVNKWPGSGYVTSKVSLATSPIKHVPKAFDLPSKLPEFKQFVRLYNTYILIM